MKLSDIDILEVGNTRQIAGFILAGEGELVVIPLPNEDLGFPLGCVEGRQQPVKLMTMEDGEWEKFIDQSDVLNVKYGKEIVRKGQRQIDTNISWKVYKRDNYRCRYCNRDAPLTVDHIIVWEQGGPTVEDNLLAACRKCNRTRGNMDYRQWILGTKPNPDPTVHQKNLNIIYELPRLESMRVMKQRSR